MNIWLGLLMGIKEVWSHKFRSFLTMLGIILGVAALLSMFAITAGIANGMREYMQQVGGLEKVNIMSQDVPVEQEDIAEMSPGRTVADAEAIAKSASLVSYVTPVSQLETCAITRGNQLFRYTVLGVWPDYVPIYKHELKRGRNITIVDDENLHNVCVIGKIIVQRLWPDQPDIDPIGQTILLNGRPFTVIGEFEYYEREEDRLKRERKGLGVPMPKKPRKHGYGWNPFDKKNSTVLIPISTMFNEFKSTNVVNGVDQGPDRKLDILAIQVADMNRFEQTVEQVRSIVLTTHRGIEDFTLETRQDMFDSIESSVRASRLTGGIIAGISLIVGGIGITNIMLASITERIREIGVRRAVGAKSRDIFMQIVVESAVIGLIGGLLGLLASFGVLKVVDLISPAENTPVVELSSVLISFSFAVIIGVLSGLYPAYKASRLDPIEALRFG